MIEQIQGMMVQFMVPITILILLRLIAIPVLLTKIKKLHNKTKTVLMVIIVYLVTLVLLAASANPIAITIFILFELAILIYWTIALVHNLGNQKKGTKAMFTLMLIAAGTGGSAIYNQNLTKGKKAILNDKFVVYLIEQVKIIFRPVNLKKSGIIIVLIDLVTFLFGYLVLLSWSAIIQKIAGGVTNILENITPIGFTEQAANLMQQEQQLVIGFIVKFVLITLMAGLIWIAIYSISRTFVIKTIIGKLKKGVLIKNLLVTLIMAAIGVIVSFALLFLMSRMTAYVAIVLMMVLLVLFIILTFVVNFMLQSGVVITGEVSKAIKNLSMKKIVFFFYVSSLLIVIITIIATPLMILPVVIQLIASAVIWLYLFVVFKRYLVELTK